PGRQAHRRKSRGCRRPAECRRSHFRDRPRALARGARMGTRSRRGSRTADRAQARGSRLDGLRVNLVLVAATIAVAALLQSASGFGFSLIAVPVISILVGARTAVVATDTLAFVLIVSL